MQNPTLQHNTNYISSIEASSRFGITKDYVSLLCRQGKVAGERVGRQWFVDPSALDAYLQTMQVRKAEKNRELSNQIRDEYAAIVTSSVPTFMPRAKSPVFWEQTFAPKRAVWFSPLFDTRMGTVAIAALPLFIFGVAFSAQNVASIFEQPVLPQFHQTVISDVVQTSPLVASVGYVTQTLRVPSAYADSSLTPPTVAAPVALVSKKDLTLAGAFVPLFAIALNETTARAWDNSFGKVGVIFVKSVNDFGGQSAAVFSSEFNMASVWDVWTTKLSTTLYPTTSKAQPVAIVTQQRVLAQVPVVQKIVYVSAAPVTARVDYVTQSSLSAQLADITNQMHQLIYNQNAVSTSSLYASLWGAIALSQRIDSLPSTVTINNSPIVTQATMATPSLASIVGTPTYGQLLLGNAAGGFDLVATSSLGITGGGGGGVSFSGTQGQIDYFNGTNNAVGTSSIFIASNKFVGIGTTTPAAALSIAYSDNSFNRGLVLTNTNGGTQAISGIAISDKNRNIKGTFDFLDANYANPLLASSVIFATIDNTKLGFIGGTGSGNPDIYFQSGANATPQLYLKGSTGYIGVSSTTPGSLLSIGTTGGINFSLGTSTFNTSGGVNINSGCYAVNSVCVGGTGGVSYSFAYPLINTSSTISLAFGTTTTNTFSQLNTFNNGIITNAATTTSLAVTNVVSSLLKTLSNGALVAAVAGVDYALPGSGAGVDFLPTTAFGAAANATSTLIGFNNGIYATASSTFTSNINVLGTAIFGTKIGIGTTSPSAALSVAGNGLFSGNLTAANITANGALTVSPLATAAGAFLAINASGQVIATTTPVSGGSSQWTTSGSDIYFNTGNVGIGTNALTANLTVAQTNSALAALNVFNYLQSGGFTVVTLTYTASTTWIKPANLDHVVVQVYGGGGGGGGLNGGPDVGGTGGTSFVTFNSGSSKVQAIGGAGGTGNGTGGAGGTASGGDTNTTGSSGGVLNGGNGAGSGAGNGGTGAVVGGPSNGGTAPGGGGGGLSTGFSSGGGGGGGGYSTKTITAASLGSTEAIGVGGGGGGNSATAGTNGNGNSAGAGAGGAASNSTSAGLASSPSTNSTTGSNGGTGASAGGSGGTAGNAGGVGASASGSGNGGSGGGGGGAGVQSTLSADGVNYTYTNGGAGGNGGACTGSCGSPGSGGGGGGNAAGGNGGDSSGSSAKFGAGAGGAGGVVIITEYITNNSVLSTNPSLAVSNVGSVGIGTSTPTGKFGISLNNGETYAGNNAFIIASTTSNSTTTLFSISNVGNALINGLLTLASGFISQASSTIGNGTQAGGLTVAGGATTTGNAYFASKVGIGTTSPYAVLSVVGQVVASYFSATSTTATSSFSGSLTAGGTNGLTVLQSGLVGIGTSSPNNGLSIAGAVASTPLLNITNTSTTSTSYTQLSFTGTGKQFYTGVGNASETNFGVANKFYVYDSTLGVMRFVIDATGNIGIGTTTPYSRFSLWGANTTSGNKVFEVTNAASTTSFSIDNAGFISAGSSNGTQPSNLFTVDTASGSTTIANLSVGNITFDVDAGMVNLADIPVDSNAAQGVIQSQSLSIGGTPILTAYGESNGSGGTQNLRVGIGTTSPLYMLDVASTTGAGAVARFTNATGNCTINPTTTSLSCSSDERLKKNIGPIATSSLQQVLALSPVFYNWNSEATGTQQHAGFIAQKVQLIFPDLVSTDGNGFLGVNYAGFVPYIVTSIQQMWTTISGFGDQFTTKKLCVADDSGASTCITKAQLDALLANAASANASLNSGSNAPASNNAPDTQAPVLTLHGSNPATLQIGDTYTDLGASVTDNVDQNLGYTVSVDGNATTSPDHIYIDTSVAGTHFILFAATDAAGNTGYSTREVDVAAASSTPQ